MFRHLAMIDARAGDRVGFGCVASGDGVADVDVALEAVASGVRAAG